MSVERESFGFMPDGKEIFKYIITNSAECSVHILTLGATVNAFYAEDKNGELRDVVLGYDTVEGYLRRDGYLGATVGPYCNRIGGAAVDINEKHYELVVNENDTTCLHSGGEFSFAVWDAIVPDADCVEMSYVSPDGEGGFPGETKVKVLFRFGEDNRLVIKYSAVSTRDTYINLTNHAYFNLKGYSKGDILDHCATVFADRYVPVDALSIPLGHTESVKDTPFDFLEPRKIGERIDDDFEQLKLTGGYDHNYCINGWDGTLRKCVEVSNDESGILMNVYTTLPGVQLYAGNFLDGAAGKNGAPMNRRSGFCLETQYYPDTPHNADFPSCLFRSGEEYSSQTVYEVCKLRAEAE